MYKITKLSIRNDANNGKTDKDIKDINDSQLKALMDIPGYMSGGYFGVEKGMSFEGTLRAFPEPGTSVFLSGATNFRSSTVEEVTQQEDGTWLIKTLNSNYLLEKLDA